jgi:hypothetical protein
VAVPIYSTALEVYAGDTWSQAFVFKTGDDPEDLTGWSDWEAEWRETPDATDSITLSASVSGDPADGTIVVSATPEQTRAMGASGVFDVQALDGVTVRTFIRCKTKWRQDVTRD